MATKPPSRTQIPCYGRGLYLAFGIWLGQMSAGPALAQFNFNPDALLPPSRDELPPSTMEDVPTREGLPQTRPPGPPRRRQPSDRYRHPSHT
jgi:hypothetical protein